jgi:hypothetical protein
MVFLTTGLAVGVGVAVGVAVGVGTTTGWPSLATSKDFKYGSELE